MFFFFFFREIQGRCWRCKHTSMNYYFVGYRVLFLIEYLKKQPHVIFELRKKNFKYKKFVEKYIRNWKINKISYCKLLWIYRGAGKNVNGNFKIFFLMKLTNVMYKVVFLTLLFTPCGSPCFLQSRGTF